MESSELVVFYGMTFYKYEGKYYCNGAFGRYVDLLSENYTKLYLVVPVVYVEDIGELSDYIIKSDTIVIQEVPYYSGYVSALKNQKKIKREIKKKSQKWNSVVYIRHPNPFTKYVSEIAKSKSLPVMLHLVGDTKSVVEKGTKYEGIVKWFAIKYINYHDYSIKKIVRTTPTLVNGDGLRRFYDINNTHVNEIRTSSFQESEIVTDLKTFDEKNIKLLYVGYLRHEKGIEYLLEALKKLKNDLSISLTIVGTGDQEDALKKKVKDLGIENEVNFTGHVALGEELFSIYKENDIFVLPSISEGTPRVLLEAMCSGVSVIATNVGGIPFSVYDRKNGLLINSKSSDAIINAIKIIVNDDKLRDSIRSNGVQFARENTLEKHVLEVNKLIKEVYDGKERV